MKSQLSLLIFVVNIFGHSGTWLRKFLVCTYKVVPQIKLHAKFVGSNLQYSDKRCSTFVLKIKCCRLVYLKMKTLCEFSFNRNQNLNYCPLETLLSKLRTTCESKISFIFNDFLDNWFLRVLAGLRSRHHMHQPVKIR